MKSILEAWYGGWILPVEMSVPQSFEYRQLGQKISDLKKQWRTRLAEEDCKMLETILDLCHDADSLESAASFECGFRLGAALMLEVLTGREELIRKEG